MLFSGDIIETQVDIINHAGALIEAGTEAMVVAIARESAPAIYLCITGEHEDFEPEEFYCFADRLKKTERVA